MFTLWFDVKIEEYTTVRRNSKPKRELWFDVKIEEYTTHPNNNVRYDKLWFDVKIEEYTTKHMRGRMIVCCGLM